MKKTSLRWAVPAAAAVAVAAAIAVPNLAVADPSDLEPMDAAELLTAAAASDAVPMSGTAVYTARLGLPELPAELTQGADPLNLLAGSSTIRVWTDGESRSRLSLLGATSEYSVVTDGAQAWTYASATDEVRHVTIDGASQAELEQAQADREAAAAAGDIPTPAEMVDHALAEAGDDADISVIDPVEVAGRAAYQLLIDPTTPQTLVDRIVVAIDGDTYVPLSVQVWSTQDTSAPAIELAFTDVSFAMPSDAALTFSKPAGATVIETVLDLSEHGESADGADAADAAEGVTVHGSGFGTVIERAGVDLNALLAGDPTSLTGTDADAEGLMGEFDRPDGIDAPALFEQLTTPVDGGRMLSTALLSVLITDDGRVFAGAVPADVLLATAGLS